MSLIRQVWLLLLATLLLAFAGAFLTSMQSARSYLEQQLSMKNNDIAQSLALNLSQLRADPTAIELTIASQFDTGFYESIRLVRADGSVLAERRGAAPAGTVPAWFARLAAIEPTLGIAQVSDGWKALGRIEVASHKRFAHEQLWWSAWSTGGVLLLLGLAAGAIGAWGVGRIRAPLEATVAQATAITERRFVIVPEPAVPELRRVSRAMNAMVERLKTVFSQQASELEQLKRAATCDPLTGLSHRNQFMAQLADTLRREDAAAQGVVAIVRIVDLAGVNQRLGRAQTDALLSAAAKALAQPAASAATGAADQGPADSEHLAVGGRLNGSDFGVLLAGTADASAAAASLAQRLRPVLAPHAVAARVAAVEWTHGMTPAVVLSAVDHELALADADAERTGEPLVARAAQAGDAAAVVGEETWRERITTALAANRAQLGSFRVVDAAGTLVHHECPLRLRLVDGEPLVTAAGWLPMARRTRLTAQIDTHAVMLALHAIAHDGQPRSVNLAPVSLLDGSFVSRLRGLAAGRGDAARHLWVELAEAAAVQHFDRLRELGMQLRPLGIKVGLEHMGQHLGSLPKLIEAGLDFVKLDASVTAGVAQDAARADYVSATVRMCRAMGLAVYAEGVATGEDARRLWDCGVDGITGPVIG
jgi:EAL domain-containing protein (putative c-di-GMP-specific phosphodiesterase class I)/GGDEF domain-containing protein